MRRVDRDEGTTHKCRIEQTDDMNGEVERHRVCRSKMSVSTARIRSAVNRKGTGQGLAIRARISAAGDRAGDGLVGVAEKRRAQVPS